MGKPKFRRGESIEVEFTFLDVNATAIDLSELDIMDLGARLYRTFSDGRIEVAVYSKLTGDGLKPLQVSATPEDGSVLLVVDPIFSESLVAGDYALQFFIKFEKSENVLYPNDYDLKVFDRDEVVFAICN